MRRLPATGEWCVAYIDTTNGVRGKFSDDKSYYTTDRADAEVTRADMAERLRAQGYRVEFGGVGVPSKTAWANALNRQGQLPESDEGKNPKPPSAERLQSYLDQVLLRVFRASPGLASFVESSRVVPESGAVELSFFKIPDEVVSSVSAAFGPLPVDILRYVKEGLACVGYRAKPTAEDLSSLAVADADDHRLGAAEASG